MDGKGTYLIFCIVMTLARCAWTLDLLHFTESDTNSVLSPCKDTTVQVGDGFTFGIAFSNKNTDFSIKGVQYSPCDKRMTNLSSGLLSLFRPRVDRISLLTINESYIDLSNPKDMVAFAGSKYAAVSHVQTVASSAHVITSFTLVLDFNKGRLQNLLWKNDGCSSCQGSSSFVCLNNAHCAIPLKDCKTQGGKVDCSLSFQTSFSGSDKHDRVMNSWYEISNMHQYSLYSLYGNLKSSLTSQFNKYIG
ncbi:hypothetical protein KP509_04G030800 [Ceratopteris richardii]|uniref:Expp1 protein n=2 Tax=Ceratopteris richardii TaxID=49495 RepID=A0A8T2UVK4_CERRI|nr:hypothetical protein KP509_04G030800 [Ceratopteris richardii]